MKQKLSDWRLAGMIFAAGLTAVTIPGCDSVEDVAGDLAEQCGLSCPAEGEGIVAGNFAISGIANIDAFFGAVVNFSGKANLVADGIDQELAKIKATLGLQANASAAEVKAAIIANYELDASAGLVVKFQEPRCAVSAEATIEATARCDASVTPGSAKVECKGSCEVEASAMASCSGSAMAKCVGQANGPMLQCEGDCSGSCELTAAATCEGTCKGTCSGTCSAENTDGSCNGECDGMCEGTCEMTVKGECSGQCKGECEYTPPMATGMCEAGATVRCEAMANASVECNGRCDGEVTPPMASAECQASAKAEAEVNVDCRPPELTLEYQFAANASAEAQLEFEAFLTGFVKAYGNIAAQLKRADIVLTAGGEIAASAGGAVEGAFQAAADGSVKATVGVACAVTELEVVPSVITAASTKLEASVSAAAALTGQFTAS
ncbi:MAG TPA: hypothetical protein VGK73_10250 [Polyangiaceae bacterium]